MKNIIFVIPNIERGGIEKNLIILSNYFIKKNYNVKIIFSKISSEVKKNLRKKITLIKCTKIINLRFISPRILNSINCFLYILLNYKFNKEQVILSFQDHPISILISKIKKIPCVIRIANHPIGSLKYFNNKLQFYIKINIKKFFYYFASGIICNSKSSTFFFKKIYKNKEIITIYNPSKKSENNNNKIERKNQIVSVGRLQNQKNFYGLIKAFALIKDKLKKTKLIIVGSGSEYKKLKQIAKKLNLISRVNFLKYQNPTEIIKNSKLFVLNSLWEGLPNILIECHNYKTPVLSSDCLSGPREILQHGKLGYLTPVNNERLLAKKIIYIFKNYKFAKKKSELAWKKLDRYNELNQCRKFEVFLDKFK
jgi:glycosyltransferase involved in cell wall biosynthesis